MSSGQLTKNRAREWSKALKELRSTREQFWRHVEIVMEIQKKGLHLEEYESFEKFLKEENDWSKQRFQQLSEACEVRQGLAKIFDHAPTKESHLKALGRIEKPGDRVKVAVAVIEKSEADGKKTKANDFIKEAEKQRIKFKTSPATNGKSKESPGTDDRKSGEDVSMRCCPLCGTGEIPKSIRDMVPEALRTEPFMEKWDEWRAFHAKEKRKPLKPTTANRQLSKLESMGERLAIEAIDASLDNGWTGIFDPKSKKKAGSFYDADVQGMEYIE